MPWVVAAGGRISSIDHRNGGLKYRELEGNRQRTQW